MEMELDSSTVVHKILKLIDDMKRIVARIVINKADFLMMAFHLTDMRPLMEEISAQQEFLKAGSVLQALQHFANVVEAIYSFTERCTVRSRIYLLYHCNDLVDGIEKLFGELAECLNSMLMEGAAIPPELKAKVVESQEKLKSTKFFQEPSHGEIAREIASALAEQEFDASHATSLLCRIADHLNVPVFEAAELKVELRNDLEEAEREGRESDVQELKGLFALLGPARVLDERRRLASADSPLHRAGIPPIPNSFFCPITRELMREPVMLAEEGYTYEKSAILEWFARGHRTCPDTGNELQSLELVPNNTLQQAMDEFFDHLYQAQMVHALQELRDQGLALQELRNQGTTTGIEEAVNTVKKLIDLDPKYKRLITSLDGVRPLVTTLKPSVPQIREKILRILYNIAALGDDYKVAIIEAEAIPVLLRILQKNPGENGGPVQLLWELSKSEAGRKAIISEKGSVLIVASAFNLCSNDQKLQAEKLLDNLCQYDSSVIIEAARSSIFGPLISSLTSGDERTRQEMATSISTSLELNEHSNTALVKAGVVPPLLNLLQQGSAESREAAAKALRCLSSIDANKVVIAKAGAIPILVKFLVSSQAQLKINVMAILSDLATDRQNLNEIDQHGAVTRLLDMLRSGDTVVQEYSLKTLQCMAKDSRTIRAAVMALEIASTMYTLLRSENLSVNCRGSILKLLYHLAEDHGTRQAVVTTEENVNFLIQQLEGNTTVEEKEAVLGILAGLSKIEQMRPLLLRENSLLITSLDSLNQSIPKIQECAAVIFSKLADPTLIEANIQMELSRKGVISSLIDVMSHSYSTDRTKQHAAAALGLFSECTPSLTVRQSIIKRILAKLGVRKYKTCRVHVGKCSVKGTFCIVEAGAVPHLVTLIKEGGHRSAERAVDTLFTLIRNAENAERGVEFLVKNDIISPLVSLVGRNETSTEKAVRMLERIFRVKKYRDGRYSNIATSSLCTTMATGNLDARKAAGTALMHLKMVPRNSTYTYTGST